MHNEIPNEDLERLFVDRDFRAAVTHESFWYYPRVYFHEHLKYPLAPFQDEICELLERDDVPLVVIAAFRGSGKTTLANLIYPTWAVIGKQQKKHIVMISDTTAKSRLNFNNLRWEFENNALLRSDAGPFQEDAEMGVWNAQSLVVSKFNARISAFSCDQSLRGLKHGWHRPDLIIIDDVESAASVKSQEQRDEMWSWFTRDILPLGDRNTKIVVLGNLLHYDSLVMRLSRRIQENKLKGAFCEYPILGANEKIMWPGKFPTMEDIEQEKLRIGDELAWRQEMMLEIVSEETQVVALEDIHHYDVIPEDAEVNTILISVDPAISQKETADSTAIIVAAVAGFGDDMRVYLMPDSVNEKMSAMETVERIASLYAEYSSMCGGEVRVLIEGTAYQQSLIEYLEHRGIPAIDVRPQSDKRARLMMANIYIKRGVALFPLKGAEHLINQVVGFGVEKHDDLCDALTMLLIHLINDPPSSGEVFWIDWPSERITPRYTTPLVEEDRSDRLWDTKARWEPERPSYESERPSPSWDSGSGNSGGGSSAGTSDSGHSGGSRGGGASINDMLGGAARRYLGR